MPDPILCDTSVWLYLGRLDHAAILTRLYQPVYTTEAVCRELDVGRLTRAGTVDPRQFSWVQRQGERVLAAAGWKPGSWQGETCLSMLT